jgi:hypothetical protein
MTYPPNVGWAYRARCRATRRILRWAFTQGRHDRMRVVLDELYRAAAREFTEDNRATLDGFLHELLQDASDRHHNRPSP